MGMFVTLPKLRPI